MATITGTSGADSRTGTSLADIIDGLAGNDTLYGLGGNDKLIGGAGTDKLYGGDGIDILDGGTGVLFADGGAGSDSIIYGPTTASLSQIGAYFAPTSIHGGHGIGADTLTISNLATDGTASARTGIYVGDNGVSEIEFTGQGDNALVRQMGTFDGIEKLVLKGKGGSDVFLDLYGAGPTTVIGGDGSDHIYGGFVRESLSGGAGNDSIYGGGGDDLLYGNGGADSFVFDMDVGGKATVMDFSVTSGDKIHIERYLIDNKKTDIVEANGVTTFHLGDSTTVVVKAVGLVEGNDWVYLD
jgi:Ca2+-binding RTX toxin-like protein